MRMRRPMIGTGRYPHRPLRKVTGELNPDWSPRGLTSALLTSTIPGLLQLLPLRQEIGQAMIDEEERIIDEFCGMKVPTEGVKSPPQYPLNTHQFEENIFCYRGKSPGEPGLVISPMFNLYKE